MVDTKISDLTDGGSVQAADEIAVARSAANRRVRIGDGVTFNPSPPSPPTAEGSLYYSSSDKTLTIHNDITGSSIQLGREDWIRVLNNSGAQIDDGTLVAISGESGGLPTVVEAQSNDQSTLAIGFATNDIANSAQGEVARFGFVRDLDTSAFTAGDILYLSADTAGAVTNVRPSAPNYAQVVGFAVTINATTGIILATNVATGPDVSGDASEVVQLARKGSAGTITPLMAVYRSGFNNGQNVGEIELADASSAANMPAIGVTRDTITNSTNGFVVETGRLSGVDTSAFSVNDKLYVSATTPGELTNVRPSGAAHLVQSVGFVVRVNASNGVIDVTGASRANDVPNLVDGSVWVGNGSNVATATTLNAAVATALPVDDTTSLVRDPADNTKQVRVDCGGLATSTTAVLTIDESIDFTEILSGTSGQKLGFNATPEAAVYTETNLANINVDGTAQTVKFVAPYDGTVVACTGETDVGTVNVAVQIDGVNVTGLTAVALDSTIAGNRDTSSAANTFSAGDVISVTTSGHASSPTAILIVVEMTQSSLPAALS